MRTPFTIRPAALDDAQSICDLINAVGVIETGESETGVAEVVRDMTRTGTSSDSDTWLAFDDEGRLVAYALVCDTYGTGRIDVDHYVLPECQQAGAVLLDLMGDRARAVARANGAPEVTAHLYLSERTTLNTSLLRERGWLPVRRYSVLTKTVTPGTSTSSAEPSLPVTVRSCADETDLRTAHGVLEQAFAAHYDHRPLGFAQWCEALGSDRLSLDTSLVWLASVEGLGVVGALAGHDHRRTMGWVHQLGVTDAVRGRGVGSRLLQAAFREFSDRGRTTVGLGVDTENTSGALKLYEGLGMVPHQAIDTWQLRSSSGVEPTHRQAASLNSVTRR